MASSARITDPADASPGRFTGGEIQGVVVTVEEIEYIDLEQMAAAALAFH
ncbi:MAG: hypothetical protein ACR2OH_05560 [Microthrixaceae bacterium]